ncbi:hypothetical protein GCM10009551_053490 [Nocardiopsis tropica]
MLGERHAQPESLLGVHRRIHLVKPPDRHLALSRNDDREIDALAGHDASERSRLRRAQGTAVEELRER